MNEKLELKTLQRVLSTIANNVKTERKKQNISQLSLAMQMGHNSVGWFSCAEIGSNNKRFNLEHLATIAKILNIPICQLFEGIDKVLIEVVDFK